MTNVRRLAPLVLAIALLSAAVPSRAPAVPVSAAGQQAAAAIQYLLRPGHSSADEIAALAAARAAKAVGVLPDASRAIFDGTHYYDVIGRFAGPFHDSFYAVMAEGRPLFVDPHANDATDAEVRRVGLAHGMPYDCIIVPGYTPTDASPRAPIDPKAVDRCRMAAGDFVAGKAPFVIVTGGNVHPEGTPQTEALLLKAELVRRGVPAARILVEGYARHSTTNLRNSARIMLDRGFRTGLIVTSGDQSFYFSWAWISTFHFRCLGDLGYTVGGLSFVDGNRTRFTPSTSCRRVRNADPLDW